MLILQGNESAFLLGPSGGNGGISFLCIEGPLDQDHRVAYELRLVAIVLGEPRLSSQHSCVLDDGRESEKVLFRDSGSHPQHLADRIASSP